MKNNMVSTVKSVMSKTKFKAKKHSPEIMLVFGIGGVIGSTVMACRATMHLDDTLKEKRERIQEIHDFVDEHGYSEEYTEKDMQKELTVTYVKAGLEVAKLYAPAVALGILSISGIVGSHYIMRKRNAALAAAYAAIDQGLKEYRKRVAAQIGEDAERDLYYGITKESVEETVTTKSGKEKTVVKEVESYDPNKRSPFSVIYDDGCIGYTKDPEYNKQFLLKQQAYANQKLKAQGYLFLNDVYKMLGFAPTKAGHVVGWIYDEKHPVGDNYVDFGLFNTDDPAARRFINGLEKNIILDFNVDGNIYDMM
jgi:hypothetical protein